MLNRLLPSRRRAEDARVARFVHAIALSGRYTLDPAWELQTVPDDQPATVAFPRIILAGTVL